MPFTSKQNTNLREFRQIVGDGARSYLFEIAIPVLSSNITEDTKTITCLARTANLPRYSIEDVPFEFQKSTFHMGGRAKFDTWQVTFMADSYHKLRNRLLAWQSVIFDPTRQVGYSPSSYKRDDVSIKQLDRMGSVVTAYTFMGLFPSEVGEIQLNHSNTAIEEFNVIFTYDYYVMGSKEAAEVKYADQQSADNLQVGDRILDKIYATKTGAQYDITDVDVNGPIDNTEDNKPSDNAIDGTNRQVTSGGSLANKFGSRGPIGFATPPTANPSATAGGGDIAQVEVDLSSKNPLSSQPFGSGDLNTPDSSNKETTLGNVLSFNPYNALGVAYSYRWMPPVKGLASIKVSRKGIG